VTKNKALQMTVPKCAQHRNNKAILLSSNTGEKRTGLTGAGFSFTSEVRTSANLKLLKI
jgi:hypothetical protein